MKDAAIVQSCWQCPPCHVHVFNIAGPLRTTSLVACCCTCFASISSIEREGEKKYRCFFTNEREWERERSGAGGVNLFAWYLAVSFFFIKKKNFNKRGNIGDYEKNMENPRVRVWPTLNPSLSLSLSLSFFFFFFFCVLLTCYADSLWAFCIYLYIYICTEYSVQLQDGQGD